MAGTILIVVGTVFGTLLAILLATVVPAYHSEHDHAGAAYIINGSTSHVRFLPTESKHSFTYPTLSLLVSLRDLELNNLDLGWRKLLFAYAPKRFSLTALSPDSYLQDDSSTKGVSMVQKIYRLLDDRCMNAAADQLGDIWTMTMPSLLGFVGVNPLTVHFCYDKKSLALLLTILEASNPLIYASELRYADTCFQVHNTFGERHVYILKVGVDEDEEKPKGSANLVLESHYCSN